MDPRHSRTPIAWFNYSKALTQLKDFSSARNALEHALAAVDYAGEPRIAADIEDARATVLAQLGEHSAAYAAVRRSQQLREQAANSGVRMKAVRMVPMTSNASNEQASSLAAARTALREAELARAVVARRVTTGAAIAAVLFAAVLALAYYYKRRAAATLALEREAAELRAERAHWQMLRYQLNPHFLYNSLASLSGLIVLDPAAARTFVGRLSDFCRLALQRAEGDLRTVTEEIQLLSAFLDIEQVGAGGNLRVRFEIDPATISWRLPPLLLQPLVENALKYGDATVSPHREIAVSTRRVAGELQIEVANTGAWTPAAAHASRRRSGSGLGLVNVRERLARIGPSAKLEVVSDQPGWVRVLVTLPALVQPDLPASRAAAI